MKILNTALVAPLLLLITACSSHYSAHGGHHRGHHHRSHVSVGVHSGHHGGAAVLGALIVGGVIGHILTEEAHQNEVDKQMNRQKTSSQDELVNGYSISPKSQQKPEKNKEQDRFYQLGQDGNCYLMENKAESTQIVSLVPKYSC